MKCACLLLILCCGCSHQLVVEVQTPSSRPIAHLTDQDKFDLLNAEAKKRGLRWKIFCYYQENREQFEAVAEHVEAPPEVQYVDQGRMDEWMSGDHSTQAGAAYALYKLIQGPPTHAAKDWFVRKENEGPAHECLRPELKGNWRYEHPAGEGEAN